MSNKILNINEVAEILGKKPNTIRMKANSDEIPYFFKIGRDWRITESDFYKWIDEQKEKSGAKDEKEN